MAARVKLITGQSYEFRAQGTDNFTPPRRGEFKGMENAKARFVWQTFFDMDLQQWRPFEEYRDHTGFQKVQTTSAFNVKSLKKLLIGKVMEKENPATKEEVMLPKQEVKNLKKEKSLVPPTKNEADLTLIILYKEGKISEDLLRASL